MTAVGCDSGDVLPPPFLEVSSDCLKCLTAFCKNLIVAQFAHLSVPQTAVNGNKVNTSSLWYCARPDGKQVLHINDRLLCCRNET